MQTLEQIAYDTGRCALADQESLVAGIRQRTGTILAAHALVASFLGSSILRAQGLSVFSWLALTALVLALLIAAVLLAPWRLVFALDARDLYDVLQDRAMSCRQHSEVFDGRAAAGFAHQTLHEENESRVRCMSRLSGLLAALLVCQMLSWLVALVVH